MVKKSTSSAKYVPMPVCNPGQKSTAAEPCITLADNGPPPASESPPTAPPATTRPSSTTPATAANTAAAPRLIGPHITTHLCQTAAGTIFECQPLADPGNPSLADYPSIGAGQ